MYPQIANKPYPPSVAAIPRESVAEKILHFVAKGRPLTAALNLNCVKRSQPANVWRTLFLNTETFVLPKNIKVK